MIEGSLAYYEVLPTLQNQLQISELDLVKYGLEVDLDKTLL